MIRDLTNQKFGKLTVISIGGKTSSGGYKWNCDCEYGKQKEISSSNLLRGLSISCGCGHFGKTTKHGLSKSRLYSTHVLMMRRCYDTKDVSYKSYGGRGITVCERWHNIANFIEDNSDYTPGLSIDRIDNNSGYSPENCRWATKKQQQRNMRTNRIITAFGKAMCLSEWSEITGLKLTTIRTRINRGWDNEKALSTKKQNHNQQTK